MSSYKFYYKQYSMQYSCAYWTQWQFYNVTLNHVTNDDFPYKLKYIYSALNCAVW